MTDHDITAQHGVRDHLDRGQPATDRAPGLHAALAALVAEWRSSSTSQPACAHDEDCVGCAADELVALLAEHPAAPELSERALPASGHVDHAEHGGPDGGERSDDDQGQHDARVDAEPSDRAGLSEAEREMWRADAEGALRHLMQPHRRQDHQRVLALLDALTVAEQERTRQRDSLSAHADELASERNQALARAEAAEQKVAAVEALPCIIAAARARHQGARCTEVGVPEPLWCGTCRARAALSDSAQVVQRIKDEATEAAAALVDAEVESEVKRLTDAFGGDPLKSPMLNNWLGGMWTAAKVIRGERS